MQISKERKRGRQSRASDAIHTFLQVIIKHLTVNTTGGKGHLVEAGTT